MILIHAFLLVVEEMLELFLLMLLEYNVIEQKKNTGVVIAKKIDEF